MNSFIVSHALKVLNRKKIPYVFSGNENCKIKYAKKFSDIVPHSVAFYRYPTAVKIFGNVGDCLLILHSDAEKDCLPTSNYIFSDYPDVCFSIVASLLLEKNAALIHPNAIIAESAQIGMNVSIGPFSVIGSDVVIGNNVHIGSHVIIENAVIGDDVFISHGVKIGSPGLGPHKDFQGKWIDFPHFAKVIIGNNVNIMDNTVICRGTLTDTVIQSNVRISSFVHISHSVICHEGVFIAAGTIIAGSASIGKDSNLWINSSIRDQTKIGDNVVIGMGSVVIKNIPNDEVWAGNPALCIKRKS